MGIINYGTQTITVDYKMQGKSELINRMMNKLVPIGIYSGGTLTKVDTNDVEVSTFLVFAEDDSVDVSVRVETAATVTKTVSPSEPYIFARMTWVNTENNYLDVLVGADTDLLANDIVFGRAIYDGGVLQTTFDYSLRTESILKTAADNQAYFMVTPTEPASATVDVAAGKALINNVYVNFSADTSGSITSTTLGRIDFIYIDQTGSIGILEGTDAGSPVAPDFTIVGLPVALITRGASRTDVRGSDITQLHNITKVSTQTILPTAEPEVLEDGSIWLV